MGPGGLYGMIDNPKGDVARFDMGTYGRDLIQRMGSTDRTQVLSALLAVRVIASRETIEIKSSDLIRDPARAVLRHLGQQQPETHATALALARLSGFEPLFAFENLKLIGISESTWQPTEAEVKQMAHVLRGLPTEEEETRACLIGVLGRSKSPSAFPPIVDQLDDPNHEIQKLAIHALAELGDKRAVEPLLQRLDELKGYALHSGLGALGRLKDQRAVEPISKYLDDPDAEISVTAASALFRLGDRRGRGGTESLALEFF